jgi:hypothetical protein
MTVVQVIDLANARVLLTSGAVLPVTRMVDEDGITTTDCAQAAMLECLGGDINLHMHAVQTQPWPTLN